MAGGGGVMLLKPTWRRDNPRLKYRERMLFVAIPAGGGGGTGWT